MPDIANVISGPANIQIDDADVAHTQGGITFNLTAQNRVQTVDKYGAGAIGIIHTGDEVTVTVPYVEWVIDVLQNIYEPGDVDLAGSSGAGPSLGFGRSAGYVYQTSDLKIIPIATSLAAKKIQIFKAIPTGEFELAFDSENDRVFNTNYTAIIDESQTDGRLLGAIFES